MRASAATQTIRGAFGEVLIAPNTGGKSVPHFHQTHAIGVNRTGGGSLFAMGRMWDYAVGMVVVTNPYDPHWGRPSPEGSDYCLLFPDPQWLRSLLDRESEGLEFRTCVLADPGLAAYLLEAFCDFVEHRDASILKAPVCELFTRYAQPAAERRGHRRSTFSTEAVGGIHTESNSEIAAAASAAGLSRSYFSRRYRGIVGLSPLDHRRQARVHVARMLIEEGAALADAAVAAGFADQPHMTREIRRVLGVTPSAFQFA